MSKLVFIDFKSRLGFVGKNFSLRLSCDDLKIAFRNAKDACLSTLVILPVVEGLMLVLKSVPGLSNESGRFRFMNSLHL